MWPPILRTIKNSSSPRSIDSARFSSIQKRSCGITPTVKQFAVRYFKLIEEAATLITPPHAPSPFFVTCFSSEDVLLIAEAGKLIQGSKQLSDQLKSFEDPSTKRNLQTTGLRLQIYFPPTRLTPEQAKKLIAGC